MFSSYSKGLLAEIYVILFYLFYKQAIVTKWRYRRKTGEIDLIMRSKNKLIFVEVKYRKNSNFIDIIPNKTLKRLAKTADIFLQEHPQFHNYHLDFQACFVSKNLKILVKENIFSFTCN